MFNCNILKQIRDCIVFMIPYLMVEHIHMILMQKNNNIKEIKHDYVCYLLYDDNSCTSLYFKMQKIEHVIKKYK